MKTEYLPTFIKDLKKLKSTSVYNSIKKLVTEEILTYQSFAQIPNLKKIKGAKNAYRIRIGDYRIGFFAEQDKIMFPEYYIEKKYIAFFLKMCLLRSRSAMRSMIGFWLVV